MLRQALRAHGLASVNVGQVEDFQGQEVKVCTNILLHTKYCST
jgi:3-hydroxyisobutyrate dehydrogenase-like beta-hydroxyacid dehydrogenase